MTYFTVTLLATAALSADIKLIIDSDAGFDVDDIGAFAIAHYLADEGKVDLIAAMSSTACDKSIAAINVVNVYYGRSDIPLGAYKGDFGWNCDTQDLYLNDLINNFPNNGIWDSGDVPDAQDAYVEVLKKQQDKSVTIAAIGFPMNVRNLLRNYPDLFEQKVKDVYWMNGYYNFGCAEHHWLESDDGDCYAAAQEVQEKFPHTVKEYFQINGDDLRMGYDFVHGYCGEDDNPVRYAYRKWLGAVGDDSRSSWDPLTVFAAIVGSSALNMWQEEGTDEIDADGSEYFDTDWTTNNEVSLWFNNDSDKDPVASEMERMMCAGKKVSQFLQ